jgi:hypothetical protein
MGHLENVNNKELEEMTQNSRFEELKKKEVT